MKTEPEDTRLGSLLLETGLVADHDLQHCLEVQALTGSRWRLGEILVDQGVLTRVALDDLLMVQATLRRSALDPQPARPAADGEDLLAAAIAAGANDLLLGEGRVASVRIAGELRPLGDEPLAGPELWNFVREHMGLDALERVAEHGAVTRPFAATAAARGRISAFRQSAGLAISARLHPPSVRTPDEARLHPALADLMRTGRGLVLLAAESGAGLTETFAALLQLATEDPDRSVHVLDRCFEYPVPDDAAIVTCRTIGRHTADCRSGVRAALRDEPDALFVAEADPDSVEHLVCAADQTLVVAGLRAPSTVHAIERVIGMRSAHDELRLRSALAAALLAVTTVRTLPDAAHHQLVPATEVLLVDDPIRDLVRNGELQQIRSLLRIEGPGHGLDTDLLKLVAAGQVRFEDAFTCALDKALILEMHRAVRPLRPALSADQGAER